MGKSHNPSMKSDNEELKSENVKLKSENEELKSENVKLKSENEELKSENVKLKSENEEKLKSDIEELKSENVKLKSENVKLKSENVKLKSENEELTQFNEKLIRKQWVVNEIVSENDTAPEIVALRAENTMLKNTVNALYDKLDAFGKSVEVNTKLIAQAFEKRKEMKLQQMGKAKELLWVFGVVGSFVVAYIYS